MLFPIIRIVDNRQKNVHPHIVGTNSHDTLIIDEASGGIQYMSLQSCAGTKKIDGENEYSFFAEIEEGEVYAQVEMLTFEQLCELYLTETKHSVKEEVAFRNFIKEVMSKHDKIIENSRLNEDNGIRHSGGRML